MKFSKIYIGLLFGATLVSCSDDENNTPSIQAPDTYIFTRDGASSVSYSGQTTRIAMSHELGSALKDDSRTKEEMLAMFGHEEGNADFSDADLNASDKNIKSKTAASAEFAGSSVDAADIRTQLENWISNQDDEVFAKWNDVASAGSAGQLVDGTSTRYVSAEGIEYNQVIAKTLIGALLADQILNNYLSQTVLDEGTNVDDNDAEVVVEGKTYTNMEHKWDEAYGYVYGGSEDQPGDLLKYIGSVDGNENYTGIADAIEDAFILGRAAIVANEYTVRDGQAEIIRENISKVIAVRAVHYLQGGKVALEAAKDAANDNLFGGAFHDLSEGLGFVYSLQFTRKPNTDSPYFSKEEVEGFIDDILANENGLWNASSTTLDEVSEEIVDAFGLVMAEAVQ
ncbi:MAG: DUF4856 domain-containing protein [Reichenbachiella sp.]|uniref:DUF4856 domain-containing protein n=1 Tax=Reichenbachiella sp. TaxID=2184521 RepID=UPI0032977E4C